MNRDTIFYTGRFAFPECEAGARRVLGIGQALRAGGFKLVFAGTEEAGRPEDRQNNDAFVYQGFSYVPESIGTMPQRKSRVRQWGDFHLGGGTVFRRLLMFDPACLRAIIVYNGPSLMFLRLLAFGRAHGIPVIADTSEWFDPCQITCGRMNPTWLDSEIRMRVMQKKTGDVFAISRFLQEYYERAGCRVIYVPPLVDMAGVSRYLRPVPVRPSPFAPLQLVYAGIPGKKDLIGHVIRAIGLFDELERDVHLTLVGPTASEVRHLLGADGALLDMLAKHITCCGRKTYTETLTLLAAADFTILLRPDKRFTRAGFPTKFVESLSLGVPVIANRTGDLGDYLTDGREGVVLDAATPEACRDGILRVLALPREQWQAMRQHARERAEASFAYERFSSALCKFVEGAAMSGH
jgi:glycosyltransferase involved in cell wall biosynthesis